MFNDYSTLAQENLAIQLESQIALLNIEYATLLKVPTFTTQSPIAGVRRSIVIDLIKECERQLGELTKLLNNSDNE